MKEKEIVCPLCNGEGNGGFLIGKGKNMDLRVEAAKRLREHGYSIRQIAKIMGFNSPGSVTNLLGK